MDTAQWPQEIVVKPMEEIIANTNGSSKPNCVERKLVRPQKDQVVNCPRCNSTNTKFCYYNNYSLSQPRYFCKTCRRYWTEGGSLRNIPVGGGSRKNKKSSSPYNSNNNVIVNNPLKKLPDLVAPPPQRDIEEYPERHFGNRSDSTPQHNHHDQNPSKIIHEGSQDLNLGFSSDFKTITELIQVPNYDGGNKDNNSPNISTLPPPPPPPSSSASSPSQLSAMELINGITSRGLNNSFMTTMPISEPNSVYNSSGFSLMPSLNFSLDHGLGNNVHSGYGNNNNLQETNTSGMFLFPFVGLKQVASTNNNTSDGANEPVGDQSTNGYWNGMLGGGGSW